MIWIFDYWEGSDDDTFTTCLNNGEPNTVIALEDDGFLPAGATSLFRRLVEEALGVRMAEEHPLFADLLEMPDLWEIRMHYLYGEIWDEGIQKAKIDYAKPVEKHNTKCVHWMDPAGLVYKRDHYDKYGQLYYTELLDRAGAVDARTWFAGKKPVLIYQPVSDTYTWFREGKPWKIFASTPEFLKFCMHRWFPDGGNIVSVDSRALEMLPEAGELPSRLNENVLILTNSDQIAHLEELVSALPVLHFHIGAVTEMSNQLYRLKRYPNVSLYPGMGKDRLRELLVKSTFYLDINHYTELYDGVSAARLYGLLVAGFDNTLHHKDLVLPECVFRQEDPSGMIRFLETAYWDSDLLKGLLDRQRDILEK